MEKFLSVDFIKNSIDFTSFSFKVVKSETILKNSYQYIITSPIKNEYQKLLLRIKLEGNLQNFFIIRNDVNIK